MTITLEASGLTCEHCAAHVREEISALEGVQEVAVNLEKGGISTITIEGDASDNALREALDDAGGYVLESVSRA